MQPKTYQQGLNNGQKNPNTQVATPQQIKDAAARQDYNKGVIDSKKK